ncbi:MAG: PEP-CTERM sorting domain-containing protein [Verrucomicrobiales bacterium]
MKKPLLNCAALLLSAGSLPAASISFNVTGAVSGEMGPTETAGVNSVANWNNLLGSSTAGGPINGSLTTVRDDSGAVLATSTISWTGTGQANAGSGGTNDQKMFESEWDLFDSGSNTGVVDMTFTITNIPYAVYDVYYYVQDASNAETRGGDVEANGTLKSIRMYNSPQGGGTLYQEADSPFTYNEATTDLGTYLRLENITGSTLTLTVSSKNPSTPRLRMSGFQVVEVPEPSGAALVGLGVLVSLTRRKR